ncbi:MAG: hypothetical protein S4CHLAM45_14750 [Chlamydiales bacterium]|nr:hypothetical protein [Chlamydiales bacterium]MCH9620563.1 hypothetical protein [Chlamydiales bacterium]MCH9623565.1 hypothetical protein [Chlamydiales bacterium]
MKQFARKLFSSLAVGVCCMMFLSTTALFAGGNYGQARPYSWYYPNNYEYYTPHRSTSTQCYYTYTNGAYVYTCS